MGPHLYWHVGHGHDILLGVDPVMGNHASLPFSDELRTYLEDLGISTLAQAHNTFFDAQQYWYTADDLYLEGEWKIVWNTFIKGLNLCGIRLTSEPDSLIWDYNKLNGMITAEKMYECIVKTHLQDPGSRLFTCLWACPLPRKIGCFIWLVLNNKILTWDNLQRKGKIGPGICSLCFANIETVNHISINCSIWKSVWGVVCEQLQLHPPPTAVSIPIFF